MNEIFWKQSVIFLSIFLLLLLVGSLVTSLWLLVGLLPAETQWAYALERPSRLGRILESQLPVDVSDVSALAVAQTNEEKVMVVRPRLLAYGRVAGGLRDNGWQVKHVGWLLQARQLGGQAWPKLSFSSFLNRWPVRPALWARGEFGQAVGVWYGQRLRLVGVGGQRAGDRRLLYSPPLPSTGQNSWAVIPGELINILPVALQQEFNQQLAGELGFSKTTPAWLPAAPEHKFIVGRVGEEVFVGQQRATEEFREQVIAWMQGEDSRLHPQRQLFHLPDGTRGYESIPGAGRAVLASVSDEDGCAEPLIETPALWLCIRDDTAIASTTKETALSARSPAATEYQLHLGRELAGQLPVADIDNISIIGSNDYAVMDVTFATNHRWP